MNGNNNKGIIIAIAVACCIISIASIFQPSLILLLGAGAYGLYQLYEYNKNQELLKKEQKQIHQKVVAETVYNIALRVLRKLSDLLDIQRPDVITDLYTEPYIIYRNGVPFIKTIVRLSKNNSQDESALPVIKHTIQTALNQGMCCGDFDDIIIPVDFIEYFRYKLIVARVYFENNHLVIEWGFQNNSISTTNHAQNAITQSKSVSKPSRSDEDF